MNALVNEARKWREIALPPTPWGDNHIVLRLADEVERLENIIAGVTEGFDSLHWGCDNRDHEYGYKKIAAALEAARGVAG